MDDTNTVTNADNTTNAAKDAADSVKQATKETVEQMPKREYDIMAGKYGSALQKIKELENTLLDVDTLKQTVSQKEKEISELGIYKEQYHKTITTKWNDTKSNITPELKKLFPKCDDESITVDEMKQYIDKWQEIEDIKATLSKEIKLVPPIKPVKQNDTVIKSTVSNWRIG